MNPSDKTQALRPGLRTTDSVRGPVASDLAAIVVNYNGWQDTAACIVSLVEGRVAPRWIMLVDNASTDDSAARLHDFLAGTSEVECDPLPFSGSRRIALRGRAGEVSVVAEGAGAGPVDVLQGEPEASAVRIVLLLSNVNGGFAAGNNIGLRWLTAHGFEGYCWLINSDACAAPDCVEALVEAGRIAGLPALFGTVLVDYDRVDRVQASGARLVGPQARTHDLHVGMALEALQALGPIRPASYPIGASLLLRQADPPVLLNEEYFLYYEEADLVRRFGMHSVSIYTRAVVAHKRGAATGGGARHTAVRDYYSIRARILFAWHDGIFSVSAASIFGGLICVKRFLTGSKGAGFNALRAVCAGLRRRGGKIER